MKIKCSVPRLQSPTVEEFTEHFVLPHKPAVICGTTDEWKARSAWTLAYLRNKLGSSSVRVKTSHTNLHPDLFSGIPSRIVNLKFAEYCDLLSSDGPGRNKMYLSGDETRFLSAYTKINPTLAPLFDDFVPPKYCPREFINTIGFWMSAEGVVSSLHFDADGSHNLNVQVKGKKRALLFPPSHLLEPFSGVSTSQGPYNFSRINILQPDEVRFPSLRSAWCLEAIIDEGDILFIPSYWHHALFHLGRFNINVNFWWRPENLLLTKTSFRAAFLALAHTAAARRDEEDISRVAKYDKMGEALSPENHRLLQDMEWLIAKRHDL